MGRPTFESLRIHPSIGRSTILFKQAQMGAPGGISPEMGQSPVTGNPDEMQAPESASQKQYEDDFGSLAYQFVQDRAPALIPYLLGFEVVDRNEDGSKAVGIFGYKVGDDFYYVPAFFLNNQVRGVDLMLNKKTNQFIPLTEKWIDFVINRHAVSMGGPADDRVRESMRNPDLTFVQRPQTAMGKIAENAGGDEKSWTSREAWEHIKEATAKMAEDPVFKEMFAGICGQVEKAAESKYIKDFMEKVGGPEAMSGFLHAMHDVEFANAAMKLYKSAEAFWTGEGKLVNAAIHVDRMKKLAAARPKIRIVDSTEGLAKAAQDTPASYIGEEDKALSVEENARQIIEHDFTIEDMRSEDEVAKVTDKEALVAFERRFNPPDGPGRYNFVMADGVTREGIMLNAVVSPSCEKNQTVFLFEDDGMVIAEASPMAVITTEFEEGSDKDDLGKDLENLFKKAVPVSEIKIGPTAERDFTPYLFVDDKGNAAGPFNIKNAINDGDYTRFSTYYGHSYIITTRASDSLTPHYGFMDWDLKDKYHDSDGRPDRNGGCDCCCDCAPCDSVDFITIGSFKGMPKNTSSGVIIPSDWKAIELRYISDYAKWIDGEKDEDHRRRADKAQAEYKDCKSRYTFGTAGDILESMKSEGVERIKVASDGTEYYFQVDGAQRQHGPMNYKQASIDLVARFGMRPRRAFSVLAKAASDGSVRLLVQVPSLMPKTEKTAQDNLVNVAMPAPLEQIPSVDPYSGVPVYMSPYVDMVRGQFTGVPGLPPEGGMTRGINIGGEMERNMGGEQMPDEHTDSFRDAALPIDEEARRLAEEAAAAGQRHVFDQAAIGGLVKVYDVANVVDSYIPEFMDTIDRLGRILFLFYWKHEDFNQRYGSDDVVQMEDRLRNVFKSLGELALQLKEKSVQKE